MPEAPTTRLRLQLLLEMDIIRHARASALTSNDKGRQAFPVFWPPLRLFFYSK